MTDAAANIGTIAVIIGTAKDWRVTLTSKATGLPLALTASDKIVLTASRLLSSGSYSTVFTRKNTAAGGSDAEIALVDGPNGIFDIKIIEANTASLMTMGVLRVECRYELASDAKDRVAFVGTLRCVQSNGSAIP